ncbi:hypothetical protein F750_6924 [Streptomyces sp. PAMC 26508]|nr:hypothetical protein F750_6924 [Streptomyces sp. PAMC 26508]
MAVSFTPRFRAGELGEWFRPWIPGRALAILEQRKGNPDHAGPNLSGIPHSESWEN